MQYSGAQIIDIAVVFSLVGGAGAEQSVKRQDVKKGGASYFFAASRKI